MRAKYLFSLLFVFVFLLVPVLALEVSDVFEDFIPDSVNFIFGDLVTMGIFVLIIFVYLVINNAVDVNMMVLAGSGVVFYLSSIGWLPVWIGFVVLTAVSYITSNKIFGGLQTFTSLLVLTFFMEVFLYVGCGFISTSCDIFAGRSVTGTFFNNPSQFNQTNFSQTSNISLSVNQTTTASLIDNTSTSVVNQNLVFERDPFWVIFNFAVGLLNVISVPIKIMMILFSEGAPWPIVLMIGGGIFIPLIMKSLDLIAGRSV